MDQLLTPDFALGSNDSAHAFMLHQVLLVSNLQRSPTSMPKLGSTGTGHGSSLHEWVIDGNDEDLAGICPARQHNRCQYRGVSVPSYL